MLIYFETKNILKQSYAYSSCKCSSLQTCLFYCIIVWLFHLQFASSFQKMHPLWKLYYVVGWYLTAFLLNGVMAIRMGSFRVKGKSICFLGNSLWSQIENSSRTKTFRLFWSIFSFSKEFQQKYDDLGDSFRNAKVYYVRKLLIFFFQVFCSYWEQKITLMHCFSEKSKKYM